MWTVIISEVLLIQLSLLHVNRPTANIYTFISSCFLVATHSTRLEISRSYASTLRRLYACSVPPELQRSIPLLLRLRFYIVLVELRAPYHYTSTPSHVEARSMPSEPTDTITNNSLFVFQTRGTNFLSSTCGSWPGKYHGVERRELDWSH